MKEHYCNNCHKPCDIYGVDEGFDYEYWGSHGRYDAYSYYSKCCNFSTETTPFDDSFDEELEDDQ